VVFVGFAFDDLNLVVDPFQFSGVDGVVSVVEDSQAARLTLAN
jgi:hypothetical protein